MEIHILISTTDEDKFVYFGSEFVLENETL